MCIHTYPLYSGEKTDPKEKKCFADSEEGEGLVNLHLDAAMKDTEVATCATHHVGSLEWEEVANQDHAHFPAPHLHLEPLLSRLQVINHYQ